MYFEEKFTLINMSAEPISGCSLCFLTCDNQCKNTCSGKCNAACTGCKGAKVAE